MFGASWLGSKLLIPVDGRPLLGVPSLSFVVSSPKEPDGCWERVKKIFKMCNKLDPGAAGGINTSYKGK